MSSFQETGIIKSFEATGVSLLNPEVIFQRFAIEQDSHESSTSEYSGEDWRKIERLVRSTVKDQSSREARKLSSLLHHISIQNELDRLKRAILESRWQVEPEIRERALFLLGGMAELLHYEVPIYIYPCPVIVIRGLKSNSSHHVRPHGQSSSLPLLYEIPAIAGGNLGSRFGMSRPRLIIMHHGGIHSRGLLGLLPSS